MTAAPVAEWTFLSLFSGCGGMDQGLERAGWQCIGQVECEPKRSSVARLHWPDVERWEDVREVRRVSQRIGDKRPSVQRGDSADAQGRGLDGGGSQQRASHRAPDPPALICGGFPCQDLSVAGRRAGLAGERSGLWWEFARILGELRPAWVLVENVPGLLSSHEGRDMALLLGSLGELRYGWAYRVLDAQFFGVAQRRRRVFIVGRLGDRAGRLPAKVLFDAASLSGNPPSRGEAGAGVAGSLAPGAGGGCGHGYRQGDLTHVAQCHGSDVGPVPFVACSLNAHSGRIDGETETFPIVPFDTTQITSAANYSNPKAGDPMHPLASGAHPPAVAFNCQQDPISGELARSPQGGCDTAVLPPAARPRRLTPRECERLQGWPDDWTRYGLVDGERVELADGPRYRMIGDGVAAPVAEWIGRRMRGAG